MTDLLNSRLVTCVEDIPGWSSLDALAAIQSLAASTEPLVGDFLELGTWFGRSANALAMVACNLQDVTLHCVDLFPDESDWYQNADSTFSFSVKINGKRYTGCVEQTVFSDVFEGQIRGMYRVYGQPIVALEKFLIRNGLRDVVKIHRSSTIDFLDSAHTNWKIKFAFIDAEHSYKNVHSEVRKLDRYLVRGGWICFDDAFTTYDGVTKVIEDLQKLGSKFGNGKKLSKKIYALQKLSA